jgi:hypothetical protein
MHHVPINTITREQARDLWRAYQKHRHWSQPIDREIAAAYAKIAQGKTVIRAIESVATGGVNDVGLPNLALARADAKLLRLTMRGDGGASMTTSLRRSKALTFDFPAGTFTGKAGWRNAEALVPLPPLNLRPKRALQNYHILWEANWQKAPPVDPFLLRRLSKHGDLWVILGVWELTAVEASVLATRRL